MLQLEGRYVAVKIQFFDKIFKLQLFLHLLLKLLQLWRTGKGLRNIFSSHATKCTYQIGHISQRQDLMVQQ